MLQIFFYFAPDFSFCPVETLRSRFSTSREGAVLVSSTTHAWDVDIKFTKKYTWHLLIYLISLTWLEKYCFKFTMSAVLMETLRHFKSITWSEHVGMSVRPRGLIGKLIPVWQVSSICIKLNTGAVYSCKMYVDNDARRSRSGKVSAETSGNWLAVAGPCLYFWQDMVLLTCFKGYHPVVFIPFLPLFWLPRISQTLDGLATLSSPNSHPGISFLVLSRVLISFIHCPWQFYDT